MPEPSRERLVKDVHRVLKHPFFIPDLTTRQAYIRLHDDHDGTGQGSIIVSFSEDGDAWIEVDPSHDRAPLRFRSFFGGGMSLRVRNALMILALAIKLDNEEHPQRIKLEGDS